MARRPSKRDVREEAERLCQQLDVDLIALATFVRRLERPGLDLRPIPEEAIERLQRMAELVEEARALTGDPRAEEEFGRLATGLAPRGARLFGSPMRLD